MHETEPPVNTTTFAASIAAVARGEIPDPVRDQARRLLLDTIACIAAGRETAAGPIAADAARLFQPELAECYALARLADCMDFNEGYAGAHFGCASVAVLLALGARRSLDGGTALRALAAGFEAGARITDAIGPYYVARPDGSTSFAPVWGIAAQGVFAAAACASVLLGLDEALMARAFDLAGSNTPVPIGAKWSAAIDLPNTKYADAGWCAVAGLFAAFQAQAGSTAVPDLLGAPDDLFTLLRAANPNPAALLDPRWRLPDMRFKAWPCCGLIRAPMAALANLCAEARIAPAAVTGIRAEVSPTIALPRFANPNPATFVARQFSLPHAATMLLLGLTPSAAWLDPAVAEHGQVRALRGKIVVEAATAPIPPQQCIVHVMAGEHVHSSRSAPLLAHAVDDTALHAKFRTLVCADDAGRLLQNLAQFDHLPECGPLLAAAGAAQPIPSVPPALSRLDALS